jgi:hypothetical protein
MVLMTIEYSKLLLAATGDKSIQPLHIRGKKSGNSRISSRKFMCLKGALTVISDHPCKEAESPKWVINTNFLRGFMPQSINLARQA